MSDSCRGVLLSEVDCSPVVTRFRSGYFYDPSTLEKVRTLACESGLGQCLDSVNAACKDDTWEGYDDEDELPAPIIPDLLRYQYLITYLRDSNRWCNNVAAVTTNSDDPGGKFLWQPTGLERQMGL
jgi:hypothetical protein